MLQLCLELNIKIYSTWLGVAETILCSRFAGLGKTIPSMHCIMFPSFLGTNLGGVLADT